jgi:hypothetical protein
MNTLVTKLAWTTAVVGAAVLLLGGARAEAATAAPATGPENVVHVDAGAALTGGAHGAASVNNVVDADAPAALTLCGIGLALGGDASATLAVGGDAANACPPAPHGPGAGAGGAAATQADALDALAAFAFMALDDPLNPEGISLLRDEIVLRILALPNGILGG